MKQDKRYNITVEIKERSTDPTELTIFYDCDVFKKFYEKKIMNCSICGIELSGYGNNAVPINQGRCCDECDKLVIVRRLNDRKRGKPDISESFRQLLQGCEGVAEACEDLKRYHPEKYGAPEEELHKNMMHLLAEYYEQGDL